MPKQEHKIQSFHGGTNNKFDPRDIGDDQNEKSQFSIRNPGRLTLEGSAMTLYDKTNVSPVTVTDVGAAGTQADPQSFVSGYGLFTFSHDYDMDATPDEVDTEFIVTNDQSSINIYDPNKSSPGWYNLDGGTAKFTVGSRLGTVKPVYYNVDGALRVCDSNFAVNTTGLSINMGSGVTKNDITLTHDTGTINAGSIIQIDQEIMYVVTSPNTTTITVIRGYANTKTATHADDAIIYYVNVPKYFGHIKQDRLFECDTSNSINAWVEDVQTPQPPNNTRKSDGTTGTLASSAGIQSLRVYDIIEASTSNYPAESEKVILELGQANPDFGIMEVAADSSGVVTITCSDTHGLSAGDEILISNTNATINSISGTQIVETTDDANNKFTINIEDYDISDILDWDDSAKVSSVSDWNDLDTTTPNTMSVDVGDTDLPASGQFWIHIKDQAGVPAFNGVYLATGIDTNTCSFVNASHASASSGDASGTVQQLIGTITKIEGNAINEDLKRKWNFAMSFTYDGPAQEVQESLLTQGHKITPVTRTDNGGSNLLTAEVDNSTDPVTVAVDDGTDFLAGDIIMLGTEQLKVGGVTSNNLTSCVRKFNNTAIDTHADDLQVFKVEELTSTATVDWTNHSVAPQAVIKTVYNHGVDEKTWNPRINGFKIYMRDVTDGDASKEWRLFSHVNFNKGTYTLFAADDSELILEQPATSAIATLTTGTSIKIKPVDTYLSENLFTEETIISAQYKAVEVVGRRAYIGNIRQGGRTYPDRMLRTPVNKFDTFPETNFIDVAVGDGDSITALKSFGDRLLQFKKNKVYIINVAGESEVLEAEYNNAGIQFPSQITKTNDGLAWINEAGLWYFDGKQIQNLTLHVEDDGYIIGTTNYSNPRIGFDKRTNRVIYTEIVNNALATKWYIYDLGLKAYQSHYVSTLLPYSFLNANYYTNMINDSNGDLIVGYVDDAENTKLNFYKWSNSDKGHHPLGSGGAVLYKTKDIDFGSPGVRKKIYKVYVTYKCTGHSGVKMKYVTNGGISPSEFSSSKSTNYDTSASGFQNSNGEWAVAELKPSSSINNVKSIQFNFYTSIIDTDDVASTGSATTAQLDSSLNDTDYNGYNLYLYDGPGKYNSAKITSYNTLNQTAEFGVLIDKGFGTIPTGSTKYILGSMASDFEINDITIVYRMKRVK